MHLKFWACSDILIWVSPSDKCHTLFPLSKVPAPFACNIHHNDWIVCSIKWYSKPHFLQSCVMCHLQSEFCSYIHSYISLLAGIVKQLLSLSLSCKLFTPVPPPGSNVELLTGFNCASSLNLLNMPALFQELSGARLCKLNICLLNGW